VSDALRELLDEWERGALSPIEFGVRLVDMLPQDARLMGGVRTVAMHRRAVLRGEPAWTPISDRGVIPDCRVCGHPTMHMGDTCYGCTQTEWRARQP
jgi:hypothetical protein